MKELTLLHERVAVKFAGYIEVQNTWIKEQEEKLADTLLGKDVSPYDLRQIVAGIKTGKQTLEYLVTYFEQFVGITYKEYCEANPTVIKVESPEEKILSAMKEFMKFVNQTPSQNEE